MNRLFDGIITYRGRKYRAKVKASSAKTAMRRMRATVANTDFVAAYHGEYKISISDK